MEFVCITKCYWGPQPGAEHVWEIGDVYVSTSKGKELGDCAVYFEKKSGSAE